MSGPVFIAQSRQGAARHVGVFPTVCDLVVVVVDRVETVAEEVLFNGYADKEAAGIGGRHDRPEFMLAVKHGGTWFEFAQESMVDLTMRREVFSDRTVHRAAYSQAAGKNC
jgi:hypothetical protein